MSDVWHLTFCICLTPSILSCSSTLLEKYHSTLHTPQHNSDTTTQFAHHGTPHTPWHTTVLLAHHDTQWYPLTHRDTPRHTTTHHSTPHTQHGLAHHAVVYIRILRMAWFWPCFRLEWTPVLQSYWPDLILLPSCCFTFKMKCYVLRMHVVGFYQELDTCAFYGQIVVTLC